MSRPRKSTFDAWLDQFALWSHDDREGAMKALELVHRTATQLEKRGAQPKSELKSQPQQATLEVVK